MSIENQRKGIGECSIVTQLLYQRLTEMKIEEIVDYDEFSEIAGLSMRDPTNQSFLRSARRKVLRENKIATDVVRGKGIKRLDDEGIVSSLYSDTKKLHRSSKRATRKVTAIEDYDKLSYAAKIKHNSSLALLSAVAVMTQSKSIKRIEQKAEQSAKRLTLAETIELFRSKNNSK